MDHLLLTNVDPQREIISKLQQFPANRRDFYHQGSVCGVITFWENDIHQHALYFSAYILPSLDKPTQLLNEMIEAIELEAKQRGKSTIICHDYAPQLTFNSLAVHNGFKLIRITVEPELSLDKLSSDGLTKNDYQVMSFAEIKNNPNLMKQLTKLHYQDYKRVHQANPVKDLTTDKWQSFIFNGQIESAPMVVINDGIILAYSFLFEDDKDILTVGWMGAKRQEALKQLHQIQLDWARGRFKTLAGEFDSTDPIAMAFYRSLPFQICPIYETYLKRIDY